MKYKKINKFAIIESGWNELAEESVGMTLNIKSNLFNMNETTKRYLISSLVTFLTAFAGVILIDIDKITLSSFSDGAIVGLVFTAGRAGVKAVLEFLLSK
jgi:hypothetical protein